MQETTQLTEREFFILERMINQLEAQGVQVRPRNVLHALSIHGFSLRNERLIMRGIGMITRERLRLAGIQRDIDARRDKAKEAYQKMGF